MTPIFADTVGLLALWDMSDQWHEAAERAFEEFSKDRRPIITTSLVLFECGNAAARRPYRAEVSRVREVLERTGLLVAPSQADLIAAWDNYAKTHVGGAGIVDMVSFEVMRRLGLSDAFTNDRHFVEAGFNVLF